MIKVGSQVRVPWWEIDSDGKSHRVADLIGIVEKINGAYHLIRVQNNSKYPVIEVYPVEMEEIQ